MSSVDKMCLCQNVFVTKNLLYLCTQIVSKKIIVDNITRVDMALMHYILNKSMSKKDVHLHLLEDWRLHFYLREALDSFEKEYGGKRKTSNGNRRRAVQ